MNEYVRLKEDNVFGQELSMDELDSVAGGIDHKQQFKRDIYKGGFPNCAATVEAHSNCNLNDSCSVAAVVYY